MRTPIDRHHRVVNVPQWNSSKRALAASILAEDRAAAGFPDEYAPADLPEDDRAVAIFFPSSAAAALDAQNQTVYYQQLFCPGHYRVRKNQRDLTANEWDRYLDAYERLMTGWDGVSLDDFVDFHAFSMTDHDAMVAWGAHTMPVHLVQGRNFLSWHREYLAKFEAALMTVNPTVTIPYWDWANDPQMPAPLINPLEVLVRFDVTQDNYDVHDMPTPAHVNKALSASTFADFQRRVEQGNGSDFSDPGDEHHHLGMHNRVHDVIGGTMAGVTSPRHPIFWLHHAFVDKLWADWQVTHGSAGHPPNLDEVLQPAPIMTRSVFDVTGWKNLGYVYD